MVGQVRCLSCGTAYWKFRRLSANTGCPACGYVGWIQAADVTPPTAGALALPLRSRGLRLARPRR